MRPRHHRTAAAALACGALLLAACGTDDGATTTPTSSGSPAADDCAKDKLRLVTPGVLTIGTDKPAYPPYFVDDDPSNGKGFESGVAYGVAERLAFTKDQVKWVVVPFNSSYAPGKKNFDFDINQISITPERQKVVDFSKGYYDVSQAVVALKGSKGAAAKTLADLKGLKLGAQVGTTSLKYLQDVVQPTTKASVFDDTNGAKQSLQNGQLDAIVVDLPTAFYVTAAEIDNSVIVGQFPAEAGSEQFGLLFEKGNPLVTCVNLALDELIAAKRLQALADEYLGSGAGVPTFR